MLCAVSFTRSGDSYLGRGTTDDKGPAVTALFGARAAREAGVPVNVRFLWETEEEVGSPHFDATLKKIGGAASADVVVVSDTEWLSRDRPALCGASVIQDPPRSSKNALPEGLGTSWP